MCGDACMDILCCIVLSREDCQIQALTTLCSSLAGALSILAGHIKEGMDTELRAKRGGTTPA